MTMKKSQWTINGDAMRVDVSFSKVDKENRLVHGFATLDNVDRQGDRIQAEANMRAFGKFRGNLREMHQPIAAGKIVDFREESYFNPEDGKTYKGVMVSAYVSKGAPLTWEKVLDGTLSGFSIGGNIVESEPVFDKDRSSTVRVIKEYDLVELSLVDSPANQLANIFSVQKSDEGSFVKGMAAEIESRNAFWCETDEIAKDSANDELTCPACDKDMTNIGWFEVVGNESTEKSLGALVNKFTAQQSEGVEHVNKNDDGVITSEDVVADNEDVVEDEKKDEDAGTEEAEVATEEVATDEPDLEKMFDDLRNEIIKGRELTAEENAALEKSFEDFKTVSEERFTEFEKKFESLTESTETMKSQVAKMEKDLDAFDNAAAVRKSSEVEVADKLEKSNKSSFKGAFGLSDLDG